MRLIKISYTLKNHNMMTVGILADNRESAIDFLLKKQPNVKTINSVMIGDDIHVVETNVMQSLMNTTDIVKDLKKEVMRLKEYLLDSDNTIAKLRDEITKNPVQAQNFNEIAMLQEKIVEMEMEKIKLLEKLNENNGNQSKKGKK
jgi:chemotaxis response regulator CheB